MQRFDQVCIWLRAIFFLIYMGFLFFYLLQEVKTRQGVYLSERERQRDYGIGPAQASKYFGCLFIFGLGHYTFHIVHRLFRVQKCVYLFCCIFPSFLFLSLSHYEEIPIVYMSSWTNFREKITRLHSYSFVSCARKCEDSVCFVSKWGSFQFTIHQSKNNFGLV